MATRLTSKTVAHSARSKIPVKSVALIATAGKLITILSAILRDGMPWQTA
jgi:hypothetical protein